MTIVEISLFILLFVAAIIWARLCSKVFSILEQDHPEEFERLGKPSLVSNNTPSTTIAFLYFLLRRQWEELDNDDLVSKCSFMAAFFKAYLIGFVIFLSVIIWGIAQ